MTGTSHIVELMSAFPNLTAPGFDMDAYNQRFRDKNYVITAKSNKIEYGKHWGCLSLKFSLKGSEFYHVGNSTYAVTDSNFLILNQDTEYASHIDSKQEVESFTLNFNEKFINTLCANLTAKTEDILEDNVYRKEQSLLFVEKLYPRHPDIWACALKIYDRLGNFYKRNDEIAELFTEIFYRMLDLQHAVQLEITNIAKVRPGTKEELYRRLTCAKEFIDSCYSEAIDLESISRVACLNKEYFIRQFKSCFKITPIQYLVRKRMDAAKNLLQSSEISITEVCQQVGYFDVSSFSKLFRRYYNVCPTGVGRS